MEFGRGSYRRLLVCRNLSPWLKLCAIGVARTLVKLWGSSSYPKHRQLRGKLEELPLNLVRLVLALTTLGTNRRRMRKPFHDKTCVTKGHLAIYVF